MKIEIKNLKIARSFSEETTAYTADVYVNGVKTFAASNHGHGGCDMFHRYNASEVSEEAVNAYLADNVAPMGPYEADPAKRAPFDTGNACNLEIYIGRAIDAFETDKTLKRALKKLCSLQNGQFYTWKVAYADIARLPNGMAQFRAKHPEQEFINDRMDDADVRRRALLALTGYVSDDSEEAVLGRLRENRLTPADARYLLASERRAAKPCADVIAHLTVVAEEGEARYAAYSAKRDAEHAARNQVSAG